VAVRIVALSFRLAKGYLNPVFTPLRFKGVR